MYLQVTQSLFRDKQQSRLFLLLSLSSLFDCILVAFRIYHVDFDWNLVQNFQDFKDYRGAYGTFLFLIWNLFLAWIPYWLALTLDLFTRLRPQASAWSIGFLLALWLLFFPNAPYIITDLLHLKDRVIVPHWYDTLMLVSFVWTGLLLGYSSLFEVQRFLESRFKTWIAWFLTILAIWLGAFGVYMGRFQRWNSWDIVRHPFSLIKEELHILMNPLQNLATLGIAIILSGFLLIGYLTLTVLRKVEN